MSRLGAWRLLARSSLVLACPALAAHARPGRSTPTAGRWSGSSRSRRWRIPLYAALLLVLPRPACVRDRATPQARGRRRPLLALAGLALHVWWFAPQVIGDNPAPAAGARSGSR